jgi:hypothetical protein
VIGLGQKPASMIFDDDEPYVDFMSINNSIEENTTPEKRVETIKIVMNSKMTVKKYRKLLSAQLQFLTQKEEDDSIEFRVDDDIELKIEDY